MNLEFTDHVQHRIEKRKLSKEEIEEAIRFPDKTTKKHGLYYFQKTLQSGKIEVVCEKMERVIKIVTVYWL